MEQERQQTTTATGDLKATSLRAPLACLPPHRDDATASLMKRLPQRARSGWLAGRARIVRLQLRAPRRNLATSR